MGKGEIVRYEQFLLFPQCFQKACFPGASKGVIVLVFDLKDKINMIVFRCLSSDNVIIRRTEKKNPPKMVQNESSHRRQTQTYIVQVMELVLRLKTLWGNAKMLVTSISPFPTRFSKTLFQRVVKAEKFWVNEQLCKRNGCIALKRSNDRINGVLRRLQYYFGHISEKAQSIHVFFWVFAFTRLGL